MQDDGLFCAFNPATPVEQHFVRLELIKRAAAEDQTVSDIQNQYLAVGMDVDRGLIRDTLHKVNQDPARPSERLVKQQMQEAEQVLGLFADRNADLRKVWGDDAVKIMRAILQDVRQANQAQPKQ